MSTRRYTVVTLGLSVLAALAASFVGMALRAILGSSYDTVGAVDRIVFIATAGTLISAALARIGRGTWWIWTYALVSYVAVAVGLLVGPVIFRSMRAIDGPIGDMLSSGELSVAVLLGVVTWLAILTITATIGIVRRQRPDWFASH